MTTRAATTLLCVFAALIVLTALLGYATRSLSLIQVGMGLRGMSPLTAGALLSLCIAVLACASRRGTTTTVAAIIATIIAAATLASHAVFGREVLSGMIGTAVFDLPTAAIGRTSIATAATVLLLAATLVVRRTRPAVSDLLCGASALISGTALLGYLYGVGDLYALPMFNSMALNTAAALFLLSAAALFSAPDRGWAALIAGDGIGGTATRRQLSFILLPVAAGWILLNATRMEAVGPAIAIALLVIVTIVPLTILILRDGRVLAALDAERQEKLRFQQKLSRDMRDELAAQAAALSSESAERVKAEAVLYRAQRMEAIGQLTGGIAHDFNNLLMAIRGNLELMQRRLPDGDARVLRHLNSALSATGHGAKITNQLLAFSRSQRLDIRATEVDPVLANARALIGNSLGPTIEIAMSVGTADVWMLADPDQLELALLNLAVNARDAMPDGGTLRIESGVRTEPAEDQDAPLGFVAIRVIDDGEGMSDAVAAKAVEPFFTTKEQGKGTGLGLAQVYGFVRQCGGDLRITSVVGTGTTIEILLPRCEAVTSAEVLKPAGHAADVQTRHGGKTVLVIDDDDTVRAVIVEALIVAGFDVVQAADGERGSALLDTLHPVAAVIDFLMPGMNGAEVARLAQARQPGLPIVFVSGYSDTVALEGISGAIVLRKPFDISGLSRAVDAVLH
jgi:signal transduction histidine kinase/CheY-like chemotaxis protein